MSYLLRQAPDTLLGGRACEYLREHRVRARELASHFGINHRKMRRLLNGTTRWSLDDWVWMCGCVEHFTEASALELWRWSVWSMLDLYSPPEPIPELEGRRMYLKGEGAVRLWLNDWMGLEGLCVDDLVNWSGHSTRRVRRVMVNQTIMMDDIVWLISLIAHHTCLSQKEMIDAIYYLSLNGEVPNE